MYSRLVDLVLNLKKLSVGVAGVFLLQIPVGVLHQAPCRKYTMLPHAAPDLRPAEGAYIGGLVVHHVPIQAIGSLAVITLYFQKSRGVSLPSLRG